MHPTRNRLVYGLIAAGVILTGLLSRSGAADKWPLFLSTYAGDTLWALTVFLALAIALPRIRTRFLVGGTIAISFTVEVSQLCRVPWLDHIRGTILGHLILGAEFKWSDLLCYTAGAVIGLAIDALLTRTTMEKFPKKGP